MKTYTLMQLIEALLAIRTRTPVGEFAITNPNFIGYGIGPYLDDDLDDIQMIVNAVNGAYREHFDDNTSPTYCMYEMSKLLKRSPQTIKRWANSGRIPAFRSPDGRLTGLFPKSDIDMLLEGGVL